MRFLWPVTAALSVQLPGRTAEWWRAGQDSSRLCICGILCLEACRSHDWVNSSVTITELLSLELLPQLPLLSTSHFIPMSKSCPFIPSLDSFRHQKSINCISWKQKRGASQGVQVQSEFSGRDKEKRKSYTCMQSHWFHTHQNNVVTAQTLAPQDMDINFPLFHKRGSLLNTTGHKTKVHNALCCVTSRHLQC